MRVPAKAAPGHYVAPNPSGCCNIALLIQVCARAGRSVSTDPARPLWRFLPNRRFPCCA